MDQPSTIQALQDRKAKLTMQADDAFDRFDMTSFGKYCREIKDLENEINEASMPALTRARFKMGLAIRAAQQAFKTCDVDATTSAWDETFADFIQTGDSTLVRDALFEASTMADDVNERAWFRVAQTLELARKELHKSERQALRV